MRIHIVSIEDSLISVGVRKMSAFVKRLNQETIPYYIPLNNYRSFRVALLTPNPKPPDSTDTVRKMAAPIADADIVAVSCMTHVADHAKALLREIKRINPQAYTIWGGIHPIIVPEDAIQHADAICTAEGEFAFEEFLDAFRHDRDFTGTRNFWFNANGTVIRNRFRPLMTGAEMDTLPLPTYGTGEMTYDHNQGAYRPLQLADYVQHVGLAYNTVWVIGCPFKCTYCGNTKFIENDGAYTRLRHSQPEWVINEVLAARRIHPHISSVVFHDDSFLALPKSTLERFVALWREKINLPFCIQGVIPNYVKADKIEVLLEGGLNRVRMGIQSGSQRILDFYKRPSPPQRILDAAATLSRYRRYMIPPAYDIIVDNPIETRSDVVETLELVYRMPRPFTFNLFSLRVQPNTDLATQFAERDISADDIADSNYLSLMPNYANCLLVMLAVWKPPRWLFDRLLRPVQSSVDADRRYPRSMLALRFLMLARRGFGHLRFMDFSVIPGWTSWLAWRLGITRTWQRWCVPRFRRKEKPGGLATQTPPPPTKPQRNRFALPVVDASSAGCNAPVELDPA